MKVYKNLSKSLLALVFVLAITDIWGQSPQYFSSGDFSDPNDWNQGNASAMALSLGSSYIHITTANSSGNKYFRFYSALSGGTTYEPNGTSDIEISYETSTNLEISGSGKAYYINASNATDNNVFKTIGSGAPGDSRLIVFKVQGDVRDVSSVTNLQSIAPGGDQTITATLSGALNTGQGVYLRYTDDNWVTSSIVEMSLDSGSDYVADIPAAINIDNTTVQYYVFTSGDGLTFGGGGVPISDANFYTISYNNNGGSNYQYRVSDQVDWANLEFPASGQINPSDSYMVGAKVYEADFTGEYDQAPNIECWIGYSTDDTNPNTWSNWYPATFFASYGDNDEYQLDLGTYLPTTPGDYFYASRFSLNGGSYQYGGYNDDNGAGGKGGFWGDTSAPGGLHVSGVVHVGDVYSITGDAADGWGVDINMGSNDGITYFLTHTLTSGGLKFRKNAAYVSGWGGCNTGDANSDFPTGVTDADDNIPITAGTYYITLNTNTNEYSFVNIDTEVYEPVSQIPTATFSSLDNTSADSRSVFTIVIQDQGSGDGLPTEVTKVRLKPHTTNTADWTDTLQGFLINDGAVYITPSSVTITDTFVDFEFTLGDVTALDDSTELELTFEAFLNTSNIVDGSILSFMVDADDHGFEADPSGSQFISEFSLGDFNSADFPIEVTATELRFLQQPVNTFVNTAMPSVIVAATDVNGNIDTDYTSNISITSSGTLSGSPVIVTASSGVATFSTLTHTAIGTGLLLTADDSSLPTVNSSAFNILGACDSSPVILTQDFESVPAVPTYTINSTVGTSVATGVGSFPADPKYVSGTQGIESSNHPTDAEIVFDDVNTSSYADIEFSVRLASFSGTSGNGHEGSDFVTIEVSENGGTYHPELRVTGFNNARWSFTSGTGVATKDYATNLVTITPAGGGDRTTDGYSTLILTGLPAVTQLSIKIVIRNDSENEFWVLDDAKLTANGGATTWDGTAWSTGSAPTISTKAVINGDYDSATDGGSIETCSCEVVAGSTLNIRDNHYLEVNDNIENKGIIEVDNLGAIVQYNDAAANVNNGTYKIQKETYTYADYDYIFWSSPVDNETIGSVFTANNSNYIWGLDAGNFLDLYSGYGHPQTAGSPDTFDDNANDWQHMASGDVLQPGVGYIAMGDDSDFPLDFVTVETTNTDAVTFDGGAINNGLVSITVERDLYNETNAGAPGTYTNADAFHTNANLIGNPYPSAIDLRLFRLGNPTLLEGTFYFWTHDTQIASGGGPWAYNYTSDDYTTTTVDSYGNFASVAAGSGTGTNVDEYVASGQAFMANVTGNGTVSFTNAMRVKNQNESVRNAQQTIDRFWLNLNKEDSYEIRQILVGFYEQATDNYQAGQDGQRMENGNNLDFYSIIPDDERHFAIQNLSTFDESKIVPLGVETRQIGNYTIKFDKGEGIFGTQQVYLYDYKFNLLHDLSSMPYNFTISDTELGEVEDRFELRFIDETAGVEEDVLSSLVVYPNPSNSEFYFNWNGSESLDVQVFDLQGRLVRSNTLSKGKSLNMSNLQAGIYLAKAKLNDQEVVKKLILE